MATIKLVLELELKKYTHVIYVVGDCGDDSHNTYCDVDDTDDNADDVKDNEGDQRPRRFSVSESSTARSEPSAAADDAKPCAREISHFYIPSSAICQLSVNDDLIRYVKR